MTVVAAYLAELGDHARAYWAQAVSVMAAVVLLPVGAVVGFAVIGDNSTLTAAGPDTPAVPDTPVPDTPVRPDADPNDTDYAFLYQDPGGNPIGFDACVETVTVVYNPDGETYAAEADLQASIDLLAAGLGRPVTYGGVTTVSNDEFWNDLPQDPTVLVNWVATPDDLPAAGPDVAGQAQSRHDGTEILGGVVTLVGVADIGLSAGMGPDSWGVVMTHELGHAAGLGHVDAEDELMYPSVLPDRAAEWGDGDLNGLRQLAGTCPNNSVNR